MKLPIYMDNHATTPVDPRVVEAMVPCFTTDFGNPASRNHPFGWKAEKLVEKSREQVARLIHADPKEIIFTSGATESDNGALIGVAQTYHEKGNHIITQVTEHKAVLDTCKYLQKLGFKVTYLPVDATGLIRIADLKAAITEQTILISIMFANNEIGTIQPIAEIGKIAKERGIVFHVDAAQAVGKIPVNVEALGIDLMSFSAHKMYGPKGVGALYVRRKNPHVRLSAISYGGGQEQNIRSGTLNVPGIVGFAKACEIAASEMERESETVAALRDALKTGIEKGLEDVHVNGHPTQRLPHNLNMSFPGVDGESLLMALNEDIAVSSGSACSSAGIEPSFVLKAIGAREDLIHSSIRFGLGRFNTQEEVDFTIRRVVETVKKLREISPSAMMRKK